MLVLKEFMKKFFAIVFILFFAGLVVFGVYAINHEDCFAHGGCLIEAVQNNFGAFREEKTPLALHIAMAAVFIVLFSGSSSKITKLFLYFLRWFLSKFIYLQTRLTRWLAIFENSPSSRTL